MIPTSAKSRIVILGCEERHHDILKPALTDLGEVVTADTAPELEPTLFHAPLNSETSTSLIFVPLKIDLIEKTIDRCQAAGCGAPILALGEDPCAEQVMKAFDLGVSDVLSTPVHPTILRVKSWRLINMGIISVADLSGLADLTMKEYRIVQTLASAFEASVPRTALARKVWPEMSISPKTIDVHIFNLRRKLRRHGYDIKSIVENGRSFALIRLPAEPRTSL